MAFNKEKVMDAARKFVDKGQVDKAVKEYLRVVKEDPQDVRVWLKIGDLYAKKGSKQEASETYLKVARFYFTQRQAYKATASRTREIIDKYPGFSRSDEALFLLGRSMFEQEDTDEAVTSFTRLCKFYPDSPYYNDSVAYLKRLDSAVPEAAPEADRPKPLKDEPGMIGKVFEVMTRPRLDYIDNDGVLFKKDEKYDAALERALKFAGDIQSAAGPSAAAQ